MAETGGEQVGKSEIINLHFLSVLARVLIWLLR